MVPLDLVEAVCRVLDRWGCFNGPKGPMLYYVDYCSPQVRESRDYILVNHVPSEVWVGIWSWIW